MKSYTIDYSAQAKQDLRDLTLYIALDNLNKAFEFSREIENEIANLSLFPLLGKEDKSTESRKLFKKPYTIYYTVDEKAKKIEIVHIRHGARKPL